MNVYEHIINKIADNLTFRPLVVRNLFEDKVTGTGSKIKKWDIPTNEYWLILNAAVRNSSRSADAYASWNYSDAPGHLMYTCNCTTKGANLWANPLMDGKNRPIVPIPGGGYFRLHDDAMIATDTTRYQIEYLEVSEWMKTR